MSSLQWNRDFALEQAADDSELLGELLEIFKGSLAADLELIAAGVRENAAAQVADAAHSIKGASASLGMDGISELARAIEADSRAGHLAVAGDQLPALHRLLEEVRRL